MALERSRGRRECRVHAAPAVSCAHSATRNAHEHTGSAEAVRHPLRSGFTAYFALSLGTGLSCPHREADRSISLSASVGAPGPHDFAVRKPHRSSCDAARVHRTPVQRFETTRNAPHADRSARRISLIFVSGKEKYFSRDDWTTQITLNPLMKFVCARIGF